MTKNLYVYIITNDKYSDDVYKLKKIFRRCDNDNFNCHIYYISKNNYKYNKKRKNRTRNEQFDEINSNIEYKNKHKLDYFYRCLNKSYDLDPNSYTLIIKDSSIYQLENTKLLKKIISDTIDIDDWDIAYLCRWMDIKSKINYITNISHIEVYNISSPNGIQSLIISPKGRNRLLGIKPLRNGHDYFETTDLNESLRSAIEEENLKAIGYNKNIFIYNPSKFNIEKNKHKYIMYKKNKNSQDSQTMDISIYVLSVTAAIGFIFVFDIFKKHTQ